MDDEGTPAYFRTSPALDGQEQQFSDELSFSDAGSDSQLTDQNTFFSLEPADEEINFWQISKSWLLSYIGITHNLTHQEFKCCHDIATAIRDSPLLTDEDHNHLYFVLLKPHPLMSQTYETSHMKKALLVVLVAVGAACVTSGLNLSVSLLLCVMLVAMVKCTTAVAGRVIPARQERNLLVARQLVTSYCSDMECLLSLLSHSLKTLQEVDMVSRHYDRGSKVGGYSAGSTSHQYLALRCSIFSLCQRTVARLRAITLSLYHHCPLNGELDGDMSKLLAQSSLSSLHSYITTDLNSISREERLHHACLSHTSLKDAANLLGVQNSELLCQTALCLLSACSINQFAGSAGVVRGERCSLLEFVTRQMEKLRKKVLKWRESLEWSRDFHRNHLFGDPPTRRRPAPPTGLGRVGHSSSAEQQLAVDVHSMDIKTQAALQRIRDFGSCLSVDETSADSISECEDKLRVIQRMVDGVTDLIEDSLSLLHKLQPSSTNTHTSEAGDREKETEEKEQDTENVDNNMSESSSTSDDEKIFEGYVAAVSEGDECGVGEGGWRVGEVVEREVSVRMVRELEDVLAVRSERREREREERRWRRRKNKRKESHVKSSLETPAAEDDGTSNENESRVTLERERAAEREAGKPRGGVTSGSSEEAAKQSALDEPRPLQSSESSLDPVRLLSTAEVDVGLPGLLAEKVATIAASRRADKPEETFGEDDD